MELRHLRYFVAVAEELHFGRAARRLSIVQPALSKQIARLEQEMGVELLYRTKRSVRLTEAGQVFVEEVRRILEETEQAVLKAQRAAAGKAGCLEVGTVGSATYGVLTEVWGLYCKRFPNVVLSPHEMTTVRQIEALRDGRIEIGFLRLPSSYEDEDLEVRAFLKESLMVALPENHALSLSDRVPLKALVDEPIIMPYRELEPHYHAQQLDAFKHAGFIPEDIQEVRQMQVGLTLVASGSGLTLVPVSVRKHHIAGVAYRKLAEPVPKVELSVAWRRGQISPLARSFLNIAEEVARKNVLL